MSLLVFRSAAQYIARRHSLGSVSLGFVPTMGALHAGHTALIARCRRENDVTAVSIFVNPSQFNDPKDLERYPRTLDADLDLLESLGVDDVFFPSAYDIYPQGYRFHLEADSLTSVMEGKHRPGFLQGVMTVVLKLLTIVRPHRAYFGEKDFQQLLCVTEMVREFFLPTEIIPCETVREPSGLALSSRNALLSPAARHCAAVIYRALTTAENCDEAGRLIASAGLRIDYVEEHWSRRFAAAFLEDVRLIDNVPWRSRG